MSRPDRLDCLILTFLLAALVVGVVVGTGTASPS